MKQVTVYLRGNYAPGGFNWYKCYLVSTNEYGIQVKHTNEEVIYPYDAQRTFFPWTNVERVDMHDK